MSSHSVTLGGFLALVGAAGVLQLVAMTGRTRIPTIGALVRRAAETRSGRLGVMAAWAWVGLHFFAR